jgi:hypothetical protein
LHGYPTIGAAQINTGVTTSVVSLVGIAGNGEWLSLSSLHPQSSHSQTEAIGLQQHSFAATGSDEQQSVCACSVFRLLQQDESLPRVVAVTDDFVSHEHPDPELKTNGCKPIAAVANIINVASNVP